MQKVAALISNVIESNLPLGARSFLAGLHEFATHQANSKCYKCISLSSDLQTDHKQRPSCPTCSKAGPRTRMCAEQQMPLGLPDMISTLQGEGGMKKRM